MSANDELAETALLLNRVIEAEVAEPRRAIMCLELAPKLAPKIAAPLSCSEDEQSLKQAPESGRKQVVGCSLMLQRDVPRIEDDELSFPPIQFRWTTRLERLQRIRPDPI